MYLENIKLIKDTFYYHRRFANKPSYYDRQELLKHNHINSYLVFEEIFINQNIPDNKKKNFFNILAYKNIFLGENFSEILSKKLIDEKAKNNLKVFDFYNSLFLAIKQIDSSNIIEAKKILFKIIEESPELITDIFLFQIIKIYRKSENIFENNFFFNKDILNFLFMIKIISSTKIKFVLFKFYICYFIFFLYSNIKNFLKK